MKTSDFSYDLPEELIAQYPTEDRDSSRMLCLESDSLITDSTFKQFADYLKPGDLIVLNDTRVIPARLFARKETGGKIEIMLERIRDDKTLLVQLRASKSPKPGTRLLLDENTSFEVLGRSGDMYLLSYDGAEQLTDVLNRLGHMPLPPYIDREDEGEDKERYQTVFSDKPGAVAAPTAGLHFTEQLLNELKEKGIDNTRLTLHVGAGTFQPVRVDDVKNHKMHSEYARVPIEVVEKINETKRNGGRVLAVGTTVVRSLETAARHDELTSFEGDTDIFIYPGFKFKIVDMMLTNFHLSESTLLMLVSAFAGKENIMNAYQHAIKEKYRFYSYGDAMLITAKV
ncbi:MAG TPA: tRNA preQ1(34) S-adenosylmethionine ribosyltransferase-isomerase QueA [Thiotrichaceae bacterium]|jgi:S-adenosylmethionine:tRNA ribosyltransferase-isomerase|nr:tRNA preQ1(34) S-adenosylmethionine ribosyltransferase-isomerase QueA [Thiotrichaceae bacterium]HIM07209.1 tRNA preQ1(34) S-adenosylmethionine ribosyltransferase-isomerase QueA [Gammaproteobacteria bacterium]